MSRKALVVLLLVALMSLLAACGGGGGGEAGGPIKVGAIFDLSGPTSDVGTPYAEGIRGYVEWLNANGGIDGREIELVWEDYAYEVPRAEQLYTQFVQEGVVAFQGWGTGDTEALRGKIAEDKLPFMSASYSHVLGDPNEAPYNFLVGTSYSHQFFIVLDWIKEDWASKGNADAPKVAFMHHPSPFGLSPWEQGGKEYADSIGIEAEAYEMPRGAPDFTAELSRIKDSGAKYVVFQTVSTPAALAIKNARGLGMDDVTFICLNWCSDEILVSQAGDAAEGVIGSFPFTPPTVDVPGLKDPADFLASKGESLEAKGVHYGQGWWTMAIMTEGIRKVVADGKEVTGENIKAALETLSNYDTGGVTVPITFTSDDHRGSKGMRLFIVRNGHWEQLTDFLTVK
ncbi:MAG: branched-chain amino acid ABC transporter substrate-binding protein [Ardenticatenia bacterium]|nr:MAG: branched-chain amino acid ABC transporter substrate-binding protein [Ardenticatenia bacterium]